MTGATAAAAAFHRNKSEGIFQVRGRLKNVSAHQAPPQPRGHVLPPCGKSLSLDLSSITLRAGTTLAERVCAFCPQVLRPAPAFRGSRLIARVITVVGHSTHTVPAHPSTQPPCLHVHCRIGRRS